MDVDDGLPLVIYRFIFVCRILLLLLRALLALVLVVRIDGCFGGLLVLERSP